MGLSAAKEGRRAFVGREPETEALLAGLGDATSGRGRFFVLGGEPGIGKTRLADEFSTRAKAEGVLVLWGRCWEAGGAPAYWPWIQSLRGLLRELDPEALRERVAGGGADLAQMLPELRERLPDLSEPSPASPQAARFRLFDALSGFLRRTSEDRPLLLVLEDLHAADTSSLLLLQFVVGEASCSRMLVLATFRDVEVTRDHPLAASLSELARAQGTTRISLAGLSRPDVGRLIETITGRTPPVELVAAIHRETEGNPLFIGEVVRALASEGWPRSAADCRPWPIPEGVREVIGRRLHRLPEDCRRILTVASVIGRDFTVEALKRITGRPAEDLLDSVHDAAEAGVISDVRHAPGTFRFAHSLIRDTLYEELTPADRIRLHRNVGEDLEAIYARDPEPHLAELAYHFFEAAPAGDVRKAVDHAVAAGRRAVALLAYEEAVRLFRMALQALRESPDEERRCQVLLLLGDAESRSGDGPASRETFLEAAGIATRLDLPELLARAAFAYSGRIPWARAGIDRQVVPLLKQALEALGAEDSVLRVLLLSRLAGALRDQPAVAPRAALGREAVAMARRIGDPETLIYALLGQLASTFLGPDSLDQQFAFAAELDRLTEQVQDRERRMDALFFRFLAFMASGQAWEARNQAELHSRLAGELRQPSHQWYAGMVVTILALQDGRFEEADHLIAKTLEAGRQAQAWDAEASHLFALFGLRREQGRLAELEDALRRAPLDYPGYRSLRCMLLATLCDLGRLDEARALFEQLATGEFATFPKNSEWLFALTLLAEAAEVLGDRDRALVLYRQLAPYAELVALAASEVSVGPVSRPVGILATLLGRHDDAAWHFEDAIARTQCMGARPWLAHTQHAYARMLAERRRPGDRERAVELLTSALEASERLGMAVLAGRVTALLAELGVRPRRRPGAATAAPVGAPKGTVLTPREREVVGLVVEGLSNRQIAEKLYLSERTAETHVQNILAKLGFTSRTQVAGWAVREGLPYQGT
jgi:DNA-binding CsgD family transcriptional regulator/tetratricopeptide (TPR) repeat protein